MYTATKASAGQNPLMRPGSGFPTASTAVQGHQFALFDVKLLGFVYRPLVMAIATQGIALVLIFQRGFLEGENVRHSAILLVNRQGAQALVHNENSANLSKSFTAEWLSLYGRATIQSRVQWRADRRIQLRHYSKTLFETVSY